MQESERHFFLQSDKNYFIDIADMNVRQEGFSAFELIMTKKVKPDSPTACHSPQ
jgi:hypothetical protein